MSEIQRKSVEGAQWFQALNSKGGIEGFAISSITPNGQLLLDSIHVIPPARGKGVGSKLLTAIFEWGKEQNAFELIGEFLPEYRGGKDEKVAREFYRKHGIEIGEDSKLLGKIR